jgi:hypothetical protein
LPGARLVDVEHEFLVPLPVRDLTGRLHDGVGDVGRKVSQLLVGLGRRLLDQPHGLNEPATEAAAADGEVLECPLGLCPVQRRGRYLHLAQGVLLDAIVVGHGSVRRSLR